MHVARAPRGGRRRARGRQAVAAAVRRETAAARSARVHGCARGRARRLCLQPRVGARKAVTAQADGRLHRSGRRWSGRPAAPDAARRQQSAVCMHRAILVLRAGQAVAARGGEWLALRNERLGGLVLLRGAEARGLLAEQALRRSTWRSHRHSCAPWASARRAGALPARGKAGAVRPPAACGASSAASSTATSAARRASAWRQAAPVSRCPPAAGQAVHAGALGRPPAVTGQHGGKQLLAASLRRPWRHAGRGPGCAHRCESGEPHDAARARKSGLHGILAALTLLRPGACSKCRSKELE